MNPRPRRIGRFVNRFVCFAFAGLLASLESGCADGSAGKAAGGNRATQAAPLEAGTLAQDPASGLRFVADANQGGSARSLRLVGAYWGRLVDVYDLDPASGSSTLQFAGLVIGADVATDMDVRLERNPVTDAESVTILHPAGTAAYAAAFERLERGLQRIEPHGLDAAGTAGLSAIPRDAALVLAFDDLLDAATITPETVRVLAGDPPLAPFAARVIADRSHGGLCDADGDGRPEFHTTRVVIDLATSELEALQSSAPLASNALGLPAATLEDRANVLLRLPTRAVTSVGQATILTNLRGAGIQASSSAGLDPKSVTLDAVIAMRSASTELMDANDGFLPEAAAPRVVGVQDVNLLSVLPQGGRNFVIDVQFAVPSCAPTPRVGDAVKAGSVIAFVTHAGSAPVNGLITGLHVVVDVGNPAGFVPGAADYRMTWDPALGLLPECFVRFSPAPLLPPAHGIAPDSTVSVRFSTAMDPASATGMDSFVVERISNASPTSLFTKKLPATVQASADLKEFTYTPTLPFSRDPSPVTGFPLGEFYRLVLAGGASGVVGLSGQPLADALPPFQFQLDPAAAAAKSRGFVFDFNSADQDNNGAPELRGQFLYDLANGSIRPRPVVRFSTVADASQPVVSLMTPFTSPIQTPLSNLGSKMMTVYRYHDLGLSLVDDSTLNIDVEGLAWAPFGAPVVDQFARFRMAFCHSKFLPDEEINMMSLLPNFPFSGLVKTFDHNQLDPVNDPLKVVHPKQKGYSIQPVDAFVATTGTLMMPYPLNRGLPTSQYVRYTFRDTGLLAVGGPNGAGVMTQIEGFATGTLPMKYYSVGKVPSLGLPLLMEFRCYADNSAFGLNGFKVNIAVNSSARPVFRAHSTGGVLASGALALINPDDEPVARGGLANGFPTSPEDDVFHLGQVDFVVRVNRVHSIWLDTFQFAHQFQAPVVEPAKALQPAGTEVVVALRGATNVTSGTPSPGGVLPARDASRYDPYGDPRAASVSPPAPFVNWAVTFPLGPGGLPDKTWKNNVAQLNNQPGGFAPRFVQMRLTLFSNPVTNAVPKLSAVGFALSF